VTVQQQNAQVNGGSVTCAVQVATSGAAGMGVARDAAPAAWLAVARPVYSHTTSWPLRRERASQPRREQIVVAARAAETEPTLIGFSHHLIAAATKA
jgi:hypothetical protein